MSARPSIAIIGAGMSGAAAARVLAEAGLGVTLFDKSRGVGGRMATRRLEGGSFDHGTQFFRPKGTRFAAAVEAWQEAGIVAAWEEDRYVGTPAMNAPVKALIGDLPVVTGAAVSALTREDGRWRVVAEGAPDTLFDAVLIAIPATQARPIAASAGWHPEALVAERYAPCWTLMLGYAEPIDLPESMALEDATISWIADNSSKPDRPVPRGEDDMHCIVVHAGPDWSRETIEDDPESVLSRLYTRYVGITGIMEEPIHGGVHRWRYALVEKPLGESHLWDAALRLGACGDWCLGPRIEAAFDSGEAAARALIASL